MQRKSFTLLLAKKQQREIHWLKSAALWYSLQKAPPAELGWAGKEEKTHLVCWCDPQTQILEGKLQKHLFMNVSLHNALEYQIKSPVWVNFGERFKWNQPGSRLHLTGRKWELFCLLVYDFSRLSPQILGSLKALSCFGFVAAFWVVQQNVKISEVNNTPLEIQTARPGMLPASFSSEGEHRHFPRSHFPGGISLVAEITHLCGLLQGSNSLSKEDVQSWGTNLLKSVEKTALQKELEQGFLADSRTEAEA